jgi:hypothetical protein
MGMDAAFRVMTPPRAVECCKGGEPVLVYWSSVCSVCGKPTVWSTMGWQALQVQRAAAKRRLQAP